MVQLAFISEYQKSLAEWALENESILIQLWEVIIHISMVFWRVITNEVLWTLIHFLILDR